MYRFGTISDIKYLAGFIIKSWVKDACGGPEKSPRTSSIVQIIFFFWSFVIRWGILRNQKFNIGLDSFSNQSLIHLAHSDNISLCIDYHLESFKLTVFGSMFPSLKGH